MPYIGKKPENIIATAVDSTTGDFSGNVTTGGTHTVTGASILNGGIDVAGDFNFDVGGGDITLKDDGTSVANIGMESGSFIVNAPTSDTDIIFKGNDGGSAITALTLDMSAAGAASFNGAVTANAGVVVDNITIDGTEIDLSSGDLTIDVAGDIILDAGGQNIFLKDDGTEFGQIYQSSNDLHIFSSVSDADFKLQGNDGGSTITALTLDMSDAGTATFNHDVKVTGNADIGATSFLVGSSLRNNDGMVARVGDNLNSRANIYFYAGVDHTGGLFCDFNTSSGGRIGSITRASSSSVAYNTSSDYRLKESITYEFDATTRLKQLKPCRFNWIADENNTLVDGFIAHEVSGIIPEAITGEKDAMAVEARYTEDDVETQGDNPTKSVGDVKTYSTTEINPQGIDQSKLVPLLTKALQEQQATIEALTARIVTLENA
jgi:hypothetical protein